MDEVERRIVDAVARGDRDTAAARILRHYGPTLLGQAQALVGSADSDDVLQATVLALLDALAAGRFKGQASLLGYAIGMVRHQAFHLRDSFWYQLFHRRSVDPQGIDELACSAPPLDEPQVREPPDAREIVARLPERDRVVAKMRIEGLSFAAIGRILGISEANAAQIHSRAVRRLQAELAGGGGGPPAPSRGARAPGARAPP